MAAPWRERLRRGASALWMCGTSAFGARRSFAVRDRRIAVTGRCKGVFECAPTIRNAQ
jgi:hypothetical protein